MFFISFQQIIDFNDFFFPRLKFLYDGLEKWYVMWCECD